MADVEYASSAVAHCYAGGRALTDSILSAWKAAVEEFLPADHTEQQVLDLGAGTGIFANAWPKWRPCRVAAIEPSEPMRLEMIRSGVSDRTHIVAGVAERLPLQTSSIDVGWLSAVVHHFSDPEKWTRELRRVARSGAVILIRGLFADSIIPSTFRHLPGSERARSRFPSVGDLREFMQDAGFRFSGRREVVNHGPTTIADASRWIQNLRRADTFLAALTDEEIDAGLALMSEHDPEELLDPSTLTLLAFIAH